jgi:hypothetical protein
MLLCGVVAVNSVVDTVYALVNSLVATIMKKDAIGNVSQRVVM